MRVARLLVVLLGCVAAGHAQDDKPTTRFGVIPDLETYPQATPRETLASVLKALGNKRVDYLLAHLADPDFVNMRVKTADGMFDELVKETTARLAADPTVARELTRFLKEGTWEASDTTATVQLKDVKDRQVFLRKIDNRWYLENRQKPADAK